MEKTKLIEKVEKAQGRSIIEILRKELAKKQRRSYKEIAKSLCGDRTTIANWAKKLNQVDEGCLSACLCPTYKKDITVRDLRNIIWKEIVFWLA